MELNPESPGVLYIGSSILAAAAVITFGTGSSSLSPVTKLSILGLIFAFFLIFGIHSSMKLLKILSYGLAALTYLIATWYGLSSFGLGSDTGFVALLLSAAVFAGLGNLITRGDISFNKRKFHAATAVIILLALSVTLFDLTGPQPSYAASLEKQVELVEGEPVRVGQILVQNSFILPRNVEIPRYEACVYTPEKQRADVSIPGRYDLDIVGGGQVEKLDMDVRLYYRSDQEPENLGTFSVEKAEECPNNSSQKKIVITETSR